MNRFRQVLERHIPAELLQSDLDEWGVEGAEITPSKLAYATTITPATIEEAHENGVDLIVSHHQCWPFMQGEREAVDALLNEYQICIAPFSSEIRSEALLLQPKGHNRHSYQCIYSMI